MSELSTRQRLMASPLFKRVLWVLFAILFYNSGQAFTIWLLEPENFAGGVDWFWMVLFPVLLPAFFVVNRHLGCASGACSDGHCELPAGEGEQKGEQDKVFYNWRSPGM
jgi:hypothetical protein